LVGPVVKAPKLVRTRRGISTLELVADELEANEARVVNGSALDGVPAPPGSATGFLSRFANQVTVLEDDPQRELLTWALPVTGRHTFTNTVFDKFFRRRFKFDTDTNGSVRAIVPTGQYEEVMPLDVLPTQLIKALASKDLEMAEKLGALELVEEDLALCEYVDQSKQPLTRWLREMLTQIEKEG
jgi:Na+-transporting NADH:ubiquinone oxidoreductase subunit A